MDILMPTLYQDIIKRCGVVKSTCLRLYQFFQLQSWHLLHSSSSTFFLQCKLSSLEVGDNSYGYLHLPFLHQRILLLRLFVNEVHLLLLTRAGRHDVNLKEPSSTDATYQLTDLEFFLHFEVEMTFTGVVNDQCTALVSSLFPSMAVRIFWHSLVKYSSWKIALQMVGLPKYLDRQLVLKLQ